MNLTNVTSFFAKLQAIGAALVALLPIITGAVQQAEAALGSGNGSAKLNYVLGIVQAAYATLQTAEAAWTDLAPAVTSTVSALVNAFNTIKTFGHAGAPAVVPAAQ